MQDFSHQQYHMIISSPPKKKSHQKHWKDAPGSDWILPFPPYLFFPQNQWRSKNCTWRSYLPDTNSCRWTYKNWFNSTGASVFFLLEKTNGNKNWLVPFVSRLSMSFPNRTKGNPAVAAHIRRFFLESSMSNNKNSQMIRLVERIEDLTKRTTDFWC